MLGLFEKVMNVVYCILFSNLLLIGTEVQTWLFILEMNFICYAHYIPFLSEDCTLLLCLCGLCNVVVCLNMSAL